MHAEKNRFHSSDFLHPDSIGLESLHFGVLVADKKKRTAKRTSKKRRRGKENRRPVLRSSSYDEANTISTSLPNA